MNRMKCFVKHERKRPGTLSENYAIVLRAHNGEQTTDISELLGTIPLYIGKRHITQPMSKSIEGRRRFALFFFLLCFSLSH